MNLNENKKLVLSLLDTFKEAGDVSLVFRKRGLKTKIKSDNTPVTDADIEVNNILINKISSLTPNIPIVSEENAANKNNKNLKDFWLIDPIDGTNDYINNKDEFTINAALIVNKKPVLGIINAPEKKRLFYSFGQENSYEIFNNNKIKLSEKIKDKNNKIKAVSYSNTLKPEILKIHKKFEIEEFQRMKSSLKFCVIAASEFDLYVAEPRACEWDIAAGHAILIHAGGKVTDFNDNEIFYGKENFKNPSIILKSKNIL